MTLPALPTDTTAKSLAGQLQIDRKRGGSLHQQIADQVEGLVRSGHLATDQRLPTHSELGRLLNVHPLTISRAYSQLQSNGLISQQRGRGSFVTGIKNTGDLRVAIILPEWATTIRQPHEAFGHYQLLGGVEDYLRSMGVNVSILSLPNDPSTDWETLMDRIASEHDGAVLTMWECISLLCRMTDMRFPCVTFGSFNSPEQVSSVYYDLYHAMYLQTEQLIKQGRRRIGYIGMAAGKHNPTAEKKFLGYLAALEDYGLPYDFNLRIQCPGSEIQPDWVAGAREMVLQKRLGDALVGEGVGAGPAVIQVLREQGVKVPDDLALVANDEPYDGCRTDPPMTWLYVPRYEMGWESGRLLLEHIRQSDTPLRHQLLEAKLVLGKSCGDPQGGDGQMPELVGRTHGYEKKDFRDGNNLLTTIGSQQENISLT